ncbi:anti-sigma factor, partial [Actinotalea sp. C106]|uniref:anti-sigma factor n=1 Tax=Actinotalea sp. C106 TaxID=2908644 RepID=UPI002028E3CC
VAVLAVPGVVAWQQAERAQQAEAQAATLTELLGGTQTVLVRSEVTGGGEAVALLGDRSAALVASDLPDLDEDAVYQLWAMRDGVPVDAGLLEVREGQVQATAAEYQAGDGLAVSVEPAGGSAQPTTEPVVVLLPG